MGNIDIYVKCYYQDDKNYLASGTTAQLYWEFLCLHHLFSEFLQETKDEVVEILNQSGQRLNKLYVDIFYKNDKLEVHLDYYTEEGCNKQFSLEFQSDGMSIAQNALVKSKIAKQTIEAEMRDIRHKVWLRELLLVTLNLTVLVSAFFVGYILNNQVVEGLFICFCSIVTLYIFDVFFDYSSLIIDLHPKETEYKTSLDLERRVGL